MCIRDSAQTALVEDARLIKDLQAADGRGDDHEDDGRPQHRDRDREELAHPSGPVHQGRLVDLARYGLHCGQEDERDVARPTEVDHRGDGDVAGQDVGVPADRSDPDLVQERVEEALSLIHI